MKPHRLPSALALVALLGLSGASAFAQTVPAPPTSQTVGGRIKITQLADLPPHTYAVSGTAADFVKDDAKMAALAAQVEVDTRHDLATYDIQDAPTLRGLYDPLNIIAMLRRDYPAALADAAQVRRLTDKPGDKLIAGVSGRALIASLQSPGADFQKTLETNLQAALEALPYEQVQDSLRLGKAILEVLSEPLLFGTLVATVDPAMQSGSVNQATAITLLNAAYAERYILPIKAALVTAYANVIAEHKPVARPDIWPSRDIALAPSPKLHPVLVGIWDTGVDLSLFPGRVWTDKDSTHGIAWNNALNPSALLLYPLAATDQEYQAYLKGVLDLQAGTDSADAAAVRAKLASLSQNQFKPFSDGMDQYADYAHGTAVAWIALRGNPAARLVVCRKSPSGAEDAPAAQKKILNALPFNTQDKKFNDEFAKSIGYFQTRHVHVVNISWAIGLADIEGTLGQYQIGKTPAENRDLAKQAFDASRAVIYASMKADPETLYIVGSGNDDMDMNFTGGIPSSFHLPNVLVVGAVDQAGGQTSFTSFGNVDVYADGFEVDGLLPGGTHANLSGTSMAAPQVTNLAAELLAVNPSLSVAQVKALIISTADARQDGGKTVRLINPKKAVAAAEKIHPSKKG